MAKVLLTYDIDSKHIAFKKELKKLGYTDQYVGKNHNNLPNTTMYHSNRTAATARDEAKELAKRLSVELERCFAVEFDSWAAITGEAHTE
jgi:hypothetical protein